MDQIKNWTFLCCALGCLAACVYLLPGLRGSRNDRALLMLTAAFGFKFVSLTLAAPAVAPMIDRLTGVTDLNALGVHIFGGVGSSAGILVALSYWTHPPERARRRTLFWLGLAVAMTAVLIGLWLVARQHVLSHQGNYLLDNMGLPLVAVYLVLYTVAFAAGLLAILLLCLRYARVAPTVWLRRGLRITAIGASVYLVYCAHRLIGMVAVNLGADLSGFEFLTPLCIGTGVPLLIIGLTLPSWGAKLSTSSRWLRDYVSYQALYPLWRDLYQRDPSIALDPPQSRLADVLRFQEISYHLCRRVVEINDGLLALSTDRLPAGRDSIGSGDFADEVKWLVRMSRQSRAAA